MARSTLASLIQQLRGLTYAGTAEYTIGTASYWDDDQLEVLLDRFRLDVFREPLRSQEELIGGGTVNWKTYLSRRQWFESTNGGTAIFVVEDSTGAKAGTALWSADYNRGVVTFAANTGGTEYYLTGRSYDLYSAAAELLTSWATKEKLAFDFTTDGQSFRESQKATMLLSMAEQYRGMSAPMAVSMVRVDAMTGDEED